MRERPILFSAPMVRAILDGRKTQTRRAVKLRGNDGVQASHEPWRYLQADSMTGNQASRHRDGMHLWQHRTDIARLIEERCPYGQPGDRLWGRETFFDTAPFKSAALFLGRARRYAYRADEEFIGCHKWKPSIHMPRRASRILLEVTAVRVERLRDITVSDAIREGYDGSNPDPVDPSIKWFSALWESINGAGSWAANPWVWAIEFRRAQP